MKTIGQRFGVMILTVACGLAVTPPTLGQSEKQPHTSAPAASPNPESGGTVSVAFRGGTVGEYVDLLTKDVKGGEINVVLSNSARLVPIGPITLRNAPIDLALAAVPAAGEPGVGSWRVERVRPSDQSMYSPPPGTNDVFRVDYIATPATKLPSAKVQRVFTIKHLTDPAGGAGTTPETLLSAIQAAIELHDQESASRTTIQYHKESGVVFVSGSRSVGELVNELLESLTIEQERLRPQVPEKYLKLEQAVSVLFGTTAPDDLATKRREFEEAMLKSEMAFAEQTRARQEITDARQQVVVIRENMERVTAENRMLVDKLERLKLIYPDIDTKSAK